MRLTTDLRTLVALLGITASAAYAQQGVEPLPYHPERLIVRFTPGTSKTARDAIHANLGVVEQKEFGDVDGLVVVKVPTGQVLQKQAAFAVMGEVLYAEPDFLLRQMGTPPNDPGYEYQWALDNQGQLIEGFEGTRDVDIDAPEAWDIFTGVADGVVGVVAGGLDYLHLDLRPHLWLNPGEDLYEPGVFNISEPFPPRCPGANDGCCPNGDDCSLSDSDRCSGCASFDCCAEPPSPCCPQNTDFDCCDDDGNGLVDDVIGYDFGEEDNNPNVRDEHATVIAGIIGAVIDNGIAISGINPLGRFAALKIAVEDLNADLDEWRAYTTDAMEAIDYMMAKNIRISNFSWGTPYASKALYDKMEAAQTGVDGGHIFVAAAGNATLDLDGVRQCVGGSKDYTPCNEDDECQFCDDPVDDPCTTDEECNPGGTCGECKYLVSKCVGGSNDGASCSNDGGCSFCDDPPGQSCTSDIHCALGGTCAGVCQRSPGGWCFDGNDYSDECECDDHCDCCTCDTEGNCPLEDPQICVYVKNQPCAPSSGGCGEEIYPCTFNLPNVICVASVNNRGERSSNSNYGVVRVDLGAPGNDVLSTTPNNSYGYRDGTSYAAPQVAGVVSLIMSQHPFVPEDPPDQQWGWEKVKAWVLTTVKPLDSLAGVTVTGGMVNACNALYDCNNNGIPPACDSVVVNNPHINSCAQVPECVPFASIPDCGQAADSDQDGMPDDCEIQLEPPDPEDPGMPKSRYLTIRPTNSGKQTALRVTLTVPDPDEPEYAVCQGVKMWVGEPRRVTEQSGSDDSSPPPTFLAAPLQERPHIMDWGAFHPDTDIHVYGAEILSGSTFDVQAVWQPCGNHHLAPEDAFSDPLEITTAIRGDLVGDFQPVTKTWTPPNNAVDFMDISADLDKFKNLPTAPAKCRADLIGHEPEFPARPDLIVNFLDIGFVVEAFRGLSYGDVYELPATCAQARKAARLQPRYVDADAKGANNGTSWTDAFTSLSTALSQAVPGDEFWVAEGTYGTITLTAAKDGVKIYGGFAGTETSASESNPDTYITKISGGGTARAVTMTDITNATIIRGFHIVNGRNPSLEPGAGALLTNSSPTFVRCTFRDNLFTYLGGAVANIGTGSPRFVNGRFYHNRGYSGGEAKARGLQGLAGAALYNPDGSPTFVNCLFYENTAMEGGAIASVRGVVTLINCTLADNVALFGNGGALYDNQGKAIIKNSILWNNVSVKYDTDEIYNHTGTTTISYSDIKGGWTGTGNIHANPKFVNSGADNYKIGGTPRRPSPCKDTGNDPSVPADFGDLDWDGNTTEQVPFDLTAATSRFSWSGVDIGAYEWTPSQQ